MDNLSERIAAVETLLKAQEKDIEEIKQQLKSLSDRLNGYLENRVRGVVKAMVGEIFLAVLTSSAVISLLISFLLRR
jgi:hypothetical protein